MPTRREFLTTVGVSAGMVAWGGMLRAEEKAAEVAAAVRRELEAGLFPGAVVMLGTKEAIRYHEAFGFAQIEPIRVPMVKDSIFDMASVTKVVATATACGICADQRLLDPDAPLTKYLPDHQGRGVDRICLRRLASHTSGFAESPNLGSKGKGEAMFQAMLRESPQWEVNTHYQYACRNVILLSTIVERVTGKPFGEFCTERIFKPLGMRESVFDRVPASPRVVAGAEYVPLGVTHNRDNLAAGRPIGNAGLFSTAADLARFCQMMLWGGCLGGTRILSEKTIADFTRTNQLPQFPGRGFLWETDPKSLHRPTKLSPTSYGHGGFTGQSLWIDPEKKVFLLVLTNRTHPKNVAGPRKDEQYRARARIGDAMLAAFAPS